MTTMFPTKDLFKVIQIQELGLSDPYDLALFTHD